MLNKQFLGESECDYFIYIRTKTDDLNFYNGHHRLSKYFQRFLHKKLLPFKCIKPLTYHDISKKFRHIST